MVMRPAERSRHELEALMASGTCAGLSDSELLGRFQGRRGVASERAFAALVDRHGPMVLRTCRAILGDRDDAEDAFQVTFLVLARKAGTIRVRESLTGWLHGVACRTSAYARGSLARRRRHERAASARTREGVADRAPDDSAAIVHEEVARLPERLRSAVLLCEFEGLSGEEAATRLNCPVGTVKSRLFRARHTLRRRLQRRDLDPSLALAISRPSAVRPGLAEATTAIACGSTAQGTRVVVTAALAAWETGVLRSLLMMKVKVAAVSLLAFGLVATGASMLAQEPTKARKQPPPAPGKAAEIPDPDLELVSTLAKSRVESAESIRNDLLRLYNMRAIELDKYLESERRVVEAKLDVCDTIQDRVAVLRKRLTDASDLEIAIREKVERGQTTKTDLKLATYARLEAALRVAETTTNRHASRKAAWPKEGLDALKIQRLLGNFGNQQMTSASEEMLERVVDFDFPRPTPLSDIFKAFKAASVGWSDSGLPIYIEPEALTVARVTLDTPVTLPKFSGKLKQAFSMVLEPLGLSYTLVNGLIRVTLKR